MGLPIYLAKRFVDYLLDFKHPPIRELWPSRLDFFMELLNPPIPHVWPSDRPTDY